MELKLTPAQKKVILAFKVNNGVYTSLETHRKFDKRVINNLLKRKILKENDGRFMLVEYGHTPEERKTYASKNVSHKPRACLCGCGGMTKGGRFLPGHDGRLHKKVLAYVRGEPCQFDRKNPQTMDFLQRAKWMTPELWRFISNA